MITACEMTENERNALTASFYDATTALLDLIFSDADPLSRRSFYEFLLQAGSWDKPQLRVLAANEIAKYFKFFPELHERAIDAMLDLCEDDDELIRKNAMSVLPLVTKSVAKFAPRIADVLCQLLQSEDDLELETVRKALLSCFSMHPSDSTEALLNQIMNGVESVRIPSITFLSTNLQADSLPPNVLSRIIMVNVF